MYYAQINAYYDIISIFKCILLCRNILGEKPVYTFGIKRGKKKISSCILIGLSEILSGNDETILVLKLLWNLAAILNFKSIWKDESFLDDYQKKIPANLVYFCSTIYGI